MGLSKKEKAELKKLEEQAAKKKKGATQKKAVAAYVGGPPPPSGSGASGAYGGKTQKGVKRPKGKLIGVSEEYEVEGATPRYGEDDVETPGTWAREKMALVQQRMAAAGLLTKFRLGVWDDASKRAYKQVLGTANAAAVDMWTALDAYVAAPQVDLDAEAEMQKKREPLVVKHMNPEEFGAVADQTAQSVLGRRLRPEEQQHIYRMFNEFETQTQTSLYNQEAQLAETGGTFTEPPDPKAFVQKQVSRHAPGEAQAHGIADYGKQFFDLLKSSGVG